MAEMAPPSPPPSRRWTAVFRGGALGDFVLTLPVLAALRAAGQPVLLVADPRHLALARAGGLAGRGSPLDDRCWGPLWSGGALAPTADALAGVRRAVVLRPAEPAAVRDRLERCGVAEAVVHDPRPPADGSRHAADHLLAALGPGATAAVPRLRLAPGAPAPRGDAPRLVAVPGAGGEGKRWPRERFADLIEGWRRGGGEAAVLLGPVELDQGEAGARLGAAVHVELDLLRTARWLAAADVVVGNDTGTSHLAAALGVATVALFGPTDPRTWAPRGERVRVLQAPAGRLADLSVARVLAAARELAAIPRGGENAIPDPGSRGSK